MGSAACAFGLFGIGIALEIDAKVSFDVANHSRCLSCQTQLPHVVFCQTDTTGQNRKHSLVDRWHMLLLTLC